MARKKVCKMTTMFFINSPVLHKKYKRMTNQHRSKQFSNSLDRNTLHMEWD